MRDQTSISIHLCCCASPIEWLIEWLMEWLSVWLRTCAAAAVGSLCTGMDRSSTADTAVLSARLLVLADVMTADVAVVCCCAVNGRGEELLLSASDKESVDALSASMGLPGGELPSRA